MSTPRPKYFCPRCRAAFDVDSNFCGRCGADMHRASRLQRAQQLDEEAARAPTIAHSSQKVALAGTQVGLAPYPADPPPQRQPRERRGSTSNDPWLGRVVDGRYRVIDVIGRGGMGVVYKVEHQRMGKIAAMKVLHRDLAGDREVIGRFQREAEAVSRLTHPNTVQVFDFGTAQGALYLVMEYVRGLDVGSLIDRDGPMTFERAAVLFDQICAALSEAHELGVVHRDLKPENILVTRAHGGQDFAKVLDFGLAKLAEREEITSSSVTGRGSIVGTPYYMSPEQIRGEEQVDARSDIYSLGALMYRVLTGCHVFTATTPVGVLTKHLTEPVTPPSLRAPAMQIPPEVDEIVMTALKKPPGERFQSAHELEERLGAVYGELVDHTASGRRPLSWRGRTTSGSISAARSTSVPHSVDDEISAGFESERKLRRSDLDAFERSIKRRRWVGFILLPVVIAAAGGGAYAYWRWKAQQPRAEEAEPNNVAGDATLIAPGAAVSGTIGRRLDPARADRDHFRLTEAPAPGGGDALSAEVTALPNIDVALSLVDGAGRVLVTRDEAGMGAPERLRAYRVRGPVVLLVTEAKSATGMPTENVSDRYRLTARLARGPQAIEVEPDDTAADAVPLAPGAAMSGWLDRRGDVDVFRLDGPAGRYAVTLASATPASVSLRGAALRPGAAVELPAGAMLEVTRAGSAPAPAGAAAPDGDDAYTLTVAPAR